MSETTAATATPIYDNLVAAHGVNPAREVAMSRVWHYVTLWGGTPTKATDDRQRRAAKALACLTDSTT